MCNVTCNAEVTFQDHLAGRAHRKAVGRSREAQDPAPPTLKIMRRPQEAGGQARPSPGPQQGQKSLKQKRVEKQASEMEEWRKELLELRVLRSFGALCAARPGSGS